MDETYFLLLVPLILSLISQALYWKPDIFSKSPKLFFEPPSYVTKIAPVSLYEEMSKSTEFNPRLKHGYYILLLEFLHIDLICDLVRQSIFYTRFVAAQVLT